MQTFLTERTIPPTFDTTDPAQVALHARWGADAYRNVGASWIGGVITADRMWSLVTAEAEEDLDRYRVSIGVMPADMIVRRVMRANGPYFAAPAGSVRALVVPPGGAR
jgi:hypothetical protein